MILVITLLITFSIFSYEAFGNQTKDIITLNLPHDNLSITIQILYCFGLLASYPIQMMPAIEISE